MSRWTNLPPCPAAPAAGRFRTNPARCREQSSCLQKVLFCSGVCVILFCQIPPHPCLFHLFFPFIMGDFLFLIFKIFLAGKTREPRRLTLAQLVVKKQNLLLAMTPRNVHCTRLAVFPVALRVLIQHTCKRHFNLIPHWDQCEKSKVGKNDKDKLFHLPTVRCATYSFSSDISCVPLKLSMAFSCTSSYSRFLRRGSCG